MHAEAAYEQKVEDMGKALLLHLDSNMSHQEPQVTGAWLTAGPSHLHVFKPSQDGRKTDSVLMNCYDQLTPRQVVFVHPQNNKDKNISVL